MADLTEPDLDVVQQEYPEPNAVQDIQRVVVPVRTVGPVTTQEMSARTAVAGYVTTVVGTPSQLAPSDLRRKNIKILLAQACFVGHVKQLVGQGESAQLTAGVVLTLDTSEAVWIMPVTTAGIASYWISQWAD